MHHHMIFVVTKIHWLKELWRHEGLTTFIGMGRDADSIGPLHFILVPKFFFTKIIDTSNPFLKWWKN